MFLRCFCVFLGFWFSFLFVTPAASSRRVGGGGRPRFPESAGCWWLTARRPGAVAAGRGGTAVPVPAGFPRGVSVGCAERLFLLLPSSPRSARRRRRLQRLGFPRASRTFRLHRPGEGAAPRGAGIRGRASRGRKRSGEGTAAQLGSAQAPALAAPADGTKRTVAGAGGGRRIRPRFPLL